MSLLHVSCIFNVCSRKIFYIKSFLHSRMVTESPSFLVLTARTCTRTCWSPASKSVTSSWPRAVTRTRSPTPSVPFARVCSIVSSSGSSRSVTRLWTPNRRDSTSLVYWILLVSRSSTWVSGMGFSRPNHYKQMTGKDLKNKTEPEWY